jgi:peptidoglycan/LPS O-acetylase OafA/YrhL
MTASSDYRRDIDGLRALAILPVLAFHAHLPGFSGGFVGVDVFFVISGFLITSILVREIDAGRFSLLRFYERRARRILPALLVVLAFVLVMAAWLYLPEDFAAVPRSELMALFFLSNVWFFMETGYFGGSAATMPLLHCWSLAVEEQFYIAFPVLLRLCAGRSPAFRLKLVTAIAVASFGLAVWKQADSDSFAFYLLPPRAWELFAGALLAMAKVPAVERRLVREGLALGGMGLILFAVVTYSRTTIFPGVAALAPVLGAVLLIHSAPGTQVGRLLSTPPLVGVGLISYSLYLWHWPVIVFAEYALDEAPQGVAQIAVIATSIFLAWASWRFVERPFRDAKRFDQRRIFVLSGGGIGAIAVAAIALLPLGGWNARFAPDVIRLANSAQDISPKRSACITQQVGGDRPECNLGAAVSPNAALWGDSHGVELAWELGRKLGVKGEALMQRTRASCPPVMGYSVATDPNCARFNTEVLERITTNTAIHRVYLAAFWASPAYQQPDLIGNIDATIARLQASGKKVTLIGPVPPQAFAVPRRLAHAAAQGILADVRGSSLASYRSGTAWFTGNYPRWQKRGVTILDPIRALADGDHTRLMLDGKPLYFDSHHLSLSGATAVIANEVRR